MGVESIVLGREVDFPVTRSAIDFMDGLIGCPWLKSALDAADKGRSFVFFGNNRGTSPCAVVGRGFCSRREVGLRAVSRGWFVGTMAGEYW